MEMGPIWVLGVLLVWRCLDLAQSHIVLRMCWDAALIYGATMG